MTNVVEEIIKKNTDTANNYGKLTALYQVLNYIQREINKLESQLPPEDK